MHNTGRFCELPSWRKAFKREWKKLANTPMETPINPKYRPDSLKWVCTCPYFVTSQFLSIGPVPATFYLKVRRNRTTPFWLHPVLQPEGYQCLTTGFSSGGDPLVAENRTSPSATDEEDSQTFRKRFSEHIETIQHFCDGLEYQLQFEDNRMLETVEREGASFLRLAQSCLSHERCMNSLRSSSPTTWERETAKVMFYRMRCRDVES
ncbi:hypothetical protein PILCRDRAFT_98766 [Piloderma croceum F 1598]|uniref:Uncharacterized protein n=1 Tax=Piloderma croceum (strain F 1598) TaxID=765440 RepID=A0A0C3F998_PILCF|nr:hypothetical protein PILCRDRAFT_98766 [Piloderma croceum F 1598]